MKGRTAGRSIAGAAALALTAACAGAPAPEAAPAPSAPPAAAPAAPAVAPPGEAEIRAMAEIVLMEDRRTLDPSRIEALASHWSPHVRRSAALALGRVRPAAPAGASGTAPAGADGTIGSSTGTLLGMLDDADETVRTNAAFALGLIGDSSTAVIGALSALARAHPADSLGTEAVAALAKAGSNAALDSVIAVLASTDSAAATPVASEALVSLWRFGPRAVRALPTAAPFARNGNAEVRWRAIYPFVRSGLSAGARLSFELADDSDHAVRALAVRGLRSPAVDSVGIGDAARAAVRAALSDPHPHVRINALGTLAASRAVDASPAVGPLLADPDGNVRMAAVQALAALGGKPEEFETVVANDAEIGVRIAALNALASLDAARAARIAQDWMREADWFHRLIAARTLGAAPWPVANAPLATLVNDEDVRVARAAIAAVARAADGDAGHAVFLDALRANDPRIRAAAIAAIARRGSPADLAVLMDAYEAASQDGSSEAAVAAVNALAALAANGSPVANAFFARFEPHPDIAVRRAVARRIGDGWGETPEEGTERGLAFYEDVVRTLVVPALAGGQPPLLRITTPDGPVDIALTPVEAPLTVHNIITLVESGYYDANGDPDSRRWHRVVPNFVLQDGEPNGDGSGNPGYSIRDEINRLRYDRGVLGMALSGPDTGSGQWFITHSPQPHLDGAYTIFGVVVNGMDAADAVVQEDRILDMQIVRR